MSVTHLRCANRVNPLGVDAPHPPLSWQLSGRGHNILQTAYEIQVGHDTPDIAYPGKNASSWSTGKVYSSNSLYIPYSGLALAPGKKYFWRVRVWDNQGHVSAWSAVATFHTGLQDPPNWTAHWISPGFPEDSVNRPPPVFRKEFVVTKKIKSATLYITAHGLYEALLNGRRIGKAFFTPGWTSYDHRLQYQCYDLTGQVGNGRNRVRVTVGDGWWRGVFGGVLKNNHYGKDAALLFQLQLEYADGTEDRITSDSSWQSGTGPIRYSDLYNGEAYDQRIEGTTWAGVRTAETYTKENLVATLCEPVTRQEVLKPLRIFTDPKGERLIDFGQNIAGWVRFLPAGKVGDTIILTHAEALDEDGNFYTGNLRAAKARDVYILAASYKLQASREGRKAASGELQAASDKLQAAREGQMLEPHFTYHGFRYARVDGWRGELNPANFEAIALSSDLPRTGTFTCSNHLLNQLQHNITWSQQDNFLDVPTDCPQRSERYGWTGDAQIFARTASFNRDVYSFFAKWLKDLAVDQGSNGGMPVIIPDFNGHRNTGPKKGVAGWGDAATIVPWTLYQAYGDVSVLEEQYASMKAWVDYIQSVSTAAACDSGRRTGGGSGPGAGGNAEPRAYLWKADGYGDWLAPDSVPTPVPFISQCYYALSTELLARTAGILHKASDSLYYAGLYIKVREALLQEYNPLPPTQTGYLLPLYFNLLPDSLRTPTVEKLVAQVRSHQDHLSTGFLGTPYLLPVLARYDYTDLAYTVLLQETAPSWLYPVKMGATTIWEKWDAITPDGKVGDKSLNHYAYGAVGDWLYREVAGISEEEPGYRTIRIQPHPGGGLTFARATYECPYGKIVSSWRRDKGRIHLHVEIPANTRAVIYLPGEHVNATRAGRPNGRSGDGQPKWVGSGSYDFSTRDTR